MFGGREQQGSVRARTPGVIVRKWDLREACVVEHSGIREIVARCRQPFFAAPPQTMLITCSDGRFTVDEEGVLAALGIHEPPDREVVPGGPGALHEHSAGSSNALSVACGQVDVLVRTHEIVRIVLVSHADCAYYARRYPRHDDRARVAQQVGDLREVARGLMRRYPQLTAECLYAQPEHGHLVLRRVEFREP